MVGRGLRWACCYWRLLPLWYGIRLHLCFLMRNLRESVRAESVRYPAPSYHLHYPPGSRCTPIHPGGRHVLRVAVVLMIPQCLRTTSRYRCAPGLFSWPCWWGLLCWLAVPARRTSCLRLTCQCGHATIRLLFPSRIAPTWPIGRATAPISPAPPAQQ